MTTWYKAKPKIDPIHKITVCPRGHKLELTRSNDQHLPYYPAEGSKTYGHGLDVLFDAYDCCADCWYLLSGRRRPKAKRLGES